MNKKEHSKPSCDPKLHENRSFKTDTNGFILEGKKNQSVADFWLKLCAIFYPHYQ